ncbi:hypothetical protein IAQ61_011665 [Plenodomus lingam]|uniref:Predicted protein n=1 Tax=Leptosphaeria maculans (strain JN3 / isolate v23.1.3 / race Av1-4-5-6-7-8) TaxID=985895 RepID=E5AAR9_LEPMJ|nr:predicted protein [Plenodomus lingam JN3]KAH9859883.1 hypothetical protein IAQ61_011665 [Plenodomus lingam]CBY00760.1 predicted protein [Plenodomus lingam JN3]
MIDWFKNALLPQVAPLLATVIVWFLLRHLSFISNPQFVLLMLPPRRIVYKSRPVNFPDICHQLASLPHGNPRGSVETIFLAPWNTEVAYTTPSFIGMGTTSATTDKHSTNPNPIYLIQRDVHVVANENDQIPLVHRPIGHPGPLHRIGCQLTSS